ncbi:MAG: hypothetical protein GTN93_06785 [Anaerolineae bacterium]|nr:hypothetical protein [Anaerolineae bacterium]
MTSFCSLYVVNTGFLDKTERAFRRDVVTTEVKKMGEFLLDMALERAQKQDVAVGFVLRYGDLREELKATAHDPKVAMVVLGKPASEGSVFSQTELEALGAEIEAETGAQVYIR